MDTDKIFNLKWVAQAAQKLYKVCVILLLFFIWLACECKL